MLQHCCAKGIALVCLYSDFPEDTASLSLLNTPELYLKAGEERSDRAREKAQGLPGQRLLEALDRCLGILGPERAALCFDPDWHGPEIFSGIRRYPGVRVLALDGRNRGQWAAAPPLDPDGFQPLEDLFPLINGGEVSGPSPVTFGIPEVWQAAGPVLEVWPAGCASPGALTRQLSSLHGNSRLPDGTAGILFMNAAGDVRMGLDELTAFLTPWLDLKPGNLIFGLQVMMTADLDPDRAESQLALLRDSGLRMVHWLAGDQTYVPGPLLWKVSKMGIWNHVSGTDLFQDPDGKGAWIANNPNIVHSFETIDSRSGTASSSVPGEMLAYGRVPPLPRVPFWQVLPDSRCILAALCHMDAKTLLRLRADPEHQQTAMLGANLEFHFQKPGDLDRQTMDEIVAMVDAGGSVDITHVRANLEKAYLIAYATEDGVIVGNSSLKHPRKVFIDRLTSITGLDFTHFVERGYTSVRPEYRAMGIGARLLEGLTQRAIDVKVFSIISEDNLATQKIAIRNNTRKIAVYFSDKLGKDMGVWMPDHMIDSSWELDL